MGTSYGRHMVAAYVVATAIYVAYSVSLWVRGRRLRERLDGERREE